MNTHVTVLMPVYNAERFLREAIDSILAQSYKKFTFLIIDDGSTDSSASIINSYNDARIHFVRNESNLGISATLNRGIELAQTALIARMDADDISHPDRLEKQVDYMLAHSECALLSCWANVITEDKRFVRLERYPSIFYYYNLTFECWMYHPTIVFRKEAVKQVNGYSIPDSEDYDLFWKLSTCFRIANLNQALVEYRLSSTSLNTVLRKQQYTDANRQNVIRNLRYYLGNDFAISDSALECLRHNFDPIVLSQSVETVYETFTILRQVTDQILKKHNPNRNPEEIRLAYQYKRQFIFAALLKGFSKSRWFELLIKCWIWTPLFSIAKQSITWRLKKMIQPLRAYGTA